MAGSGQALEPGVTKQQLYEQYARLGKVIAHATRIEMLELLAQGERTVESLAGVTGNGVTNASAHLQVLRRARLVETRKVGTHVFYRLAGDEVVHFLASLRELARARLVEVDALVRDYFEARDALEPVRMDDLVTRARRGEVVVIDVRPVIEYEAGHIPGAVSIPLEELESRIKELPRRAEVVAYCRGPYCVLASEAVEELTRNGRRARRLEGGLPEWRISGRRVAVGHGADEEDEG